MPEHRTSSEHRLHLLTRYIGALEQGEIEPLIGVLSEAEHDPVLAQLLQEVNTLYQEIDHTAVSQFQARHALQMFLASFQISSDTREDEGAPEQEQPAYIRKIHIQHGKKKISMEEQEITPVQLRSNGAPYKSKRTRWGWMQTLAAVLVVGVLITATPLLLKLRQQAGAGSQQHLLGATATPTIDPHNYSALASQYVAHMSLDDEIAQLIMAEYSSPTYSSDLDHMLRTQHVGAIIMYGYQLTGLKQAKGDITHMQQRASIPLLIATDQEGGIVDRLSQIYGPSMSATDIEKSGSTDVATQQGLKTSQNLRALGINIDLAPDVDVNQVNGYDMVDRTFGNTPQEVLKYASPYLQAMQGNGTIGCLKHFPGLGGAVSNADATLPIVNNSAQDIYSIDLAPFKTLIQSPNPLLNPGMVMSADVLMPAIDPKYPAELSYNFITGILRNQLHYNGVVLTDALYMEGISKTWNLGEAAVLALQAGDDMLLGADGSQQVSDMMNAIKQAVQNGQLTKSRIDQSATRIIALKMQYHLMPTSAPGV